LQRKSDIVYLPIRTYILCVYTHTYTKTDVYRVVHQECSSPPLHFYFNNEFIRVLLFEFWNYSTPVSNSYWLFSNIILCTSFFFKEFKAYSVAIQINFFKRAPTCFFLNRWCVRFEIQTNRHLVSELYNFKSVLRVTVHDTGFKKKTRPWWYENYK